jgi:hypothetical protein
LKNKICKTMIFPTWAQADGAAYRTDNLRIVKGSDVFIDPDLGSLLPDQFIIFDDSAAGDTATSYQEDGLATAGYVDITTYTSGTITFGMKVVQQLTSDADWLAKVECTYPCQSAEITMVSQAAFPVGTWRPVTINIDDLAGLICPL